MKSININFLFSFICFVVLLGIPNNASSVVPLHDLQEFNKTTKNILIQPAPFLLADTANLKDEETKRNKPRNLKERLILSFSTSRAIQMYKHGKDGCSKLKRRSQNSLVFGLVGLLVAGLLLGIMAVLAGFEALRLAKENPDCPDIDKKILKAQIGIIIGILDIVIGLLLIAAIILR